MVRLPLIRVAHPSKEECDNEVQRIQSHLYPEKEGKKVKVQEDEEDFVRVERKDPPTSYTPNLFNFEHHYDPELTPRRPW